MKTSRIALLCLPALLAACASMPEGPTVRALPPQGKPFEQFAAEQDMCKQYASDQVRGQAENANNTGVLEGVGGTILGAGLGAALGGGNGAAVGAAAGALGGTAVGASTSGNRQGGIQQQYDNAYTACMVSKGNQVQQPVVRQRVIVRQAPPPVVYAPPPTVVYEAPPGYYYAR